jgi:V/A-type H+-transporting ATPase subunit A
VGRGAPRDRCAPRRDAGRVSPPGGDLSEPVTQASLRVSGALWALSSELAHARQYPAVDWETSYSLYTEATEEWFEIEGGEDWAELRGQLLDLLDHDRELREIAGLVGADALEDLDRLDLEVARLARETLLGQSAFDPDDAFSPPGKTHRLAMALVALRRRGVEALEAGLDFRQLDLAGARRALIRLRSSSGEAVDEAATAVDDAIARLRTEITAGSEEAGS